MKTFLDFKNKSLLPVILSALAVVCALVAVIIYGATGVTNYTANKLDSGVIAFTVIGMAIALASIVFDLKLVKHAACYYASVRERIVALTYDRITESCHGISCLSSFRCRSSCISRRTRCSL